MPRARNELAKATKAPNKMRRPCSAKMSLKRKRENPKRPPATNVVGQPPKQSADAREA
jgi:hypothetical protein